MRKERTAGTPLPLRTGVSYLVRFLSLLTPLPSLLVALACLVAFFLRIYHAGDQGIWGDEIFSVWYAGMSLPDIIRLNLVNLDAHAPLFYYVLKFWTLLAGQNELIFRFPSAFFGVLAIPLIYLLGRRLVGPGVGVTAGLIMALNPFQVWYSQETRTYALTTFLTLLSVLLFLRLLQKTREEYRGWLWVAYCLTTLLGISSHYYAFLIMGFEDLYLALLLARRKLDWRPWAAVHAALLIPLLAGIWQAGNMMLRYPPERLPLDSLGLLRDYFVQYNVGWFVGPGLGYPALAVSLAFAAAGLIYLLRAHAGRPWPGIFLASYLMIPFAGALLYFWVTAGFPPRERYLIIVTPAFYLLIAGGVVLTKRLSPFLLAVALLAVVSPPVLALGNYYQNPSYARPDYRAIARHIQTWEDKSDAVVAISHLPADIFRYYYKGGAPVTQFRYHPGENTREEIRAGLEELAKQYKRIWLLPNGDGRGDPEAEEWLNDNAFEAENGWVAGARLALYVTERGASGDPVGVAANVAGRVELASYSALPASVSSGDIVTLGLAWRALQDLDQGYKVSLRLRDERGHLLNQVDRPLGGAIRNGASLRQGETMTDKVGLRAPYGLVPGPVSVEVGLYLEKDGLALSFLDANGAPKGTWLTLGRVQVTRGPQVALDRLEIPQRTTRDLGGGLRLVGFGLGRESIMPGETFTLSLFWQALAGLPGGARTKIRLVGEKGDVLVAVDGRAAGGWKEGDVFREFAALTIPAGAANGRYRLGVLDEAGGEATLGEVSVKARERRFEMPKPQQALATAWGDVAKLRGFDLSGERGGGREPLAVKPGETLALTLYWEALQSSAVSYTVFTHLLDGKVRLWGQHDGIPASGAAPTTGWVKGELVTDLHDIVVNDGAPAGEYVIEVGLYDAATGKRLTTDTGEDGLIIAKVAVGQ